MSSIKIKRIASQIAKEVSNILSNESRDDNFKTVTITGAEVTNDLSFAKVYYTVLDATKKVYFTVINDSQKDMILKELNEAAGFIRKEIAEAIELRHTPEISFHYDESIAYGNNIERIIKEIHEEKEEI